MKNVKNTFAAFTMMAVMAFGTTFANAGIIIALNSDGSTKSETTKTSTEPCSEPQSDLVGIIIAFTGIVITAKTGIIIARGKDTSVVNCGIIIA